MADKLELEMGLASKQVRLGELAPKDREQLKLILELIAEKKGEGTVILDLRGFTLPTSYFVITEGESEKQVEAIAENILEKFPGPPPLEEGLDTKNWVVLDFGHFMVHIFKPETRRFYDLEGLWGEVEIELDLDLDLNPEPKPELGSESSSSEGDQGPH